MTSMTGDRTARRGILGIRAVGFAMAVCSLTWAAEGPPDVLGLDRLGATTLADVAVDRSDSALSGDAFILRPVDETSEEPVPAASETREQMLAWLGEYAKHQVLFDYHDMVALRKALVTVPDDQLDRWAADTQLFRERLSDESWQMTQQWLRDFLSAQAIYEPDRIETLRGQFATLRPAQLLAVVDHFQSIHLRRLRSRQATDHLRSHSISMSAPGRRRISPSSLRAASFSSGDSFPSTAGSRTNSLAHRNRVVYRRRSPLSRRISNYYVNRAVFGGWRFW